VNPAFFIAPAMKPRTVCFCQPMVVMISANVTPPSAAATPLPAYRRPISVTGVFRPGGFCAVSRNPLQGDHLVWARYSFGVLDYQGAELFRFEHNSGLTDVAFSHDGRRLAAVDASGVQVYALAVEDLIRLARPNMPEAVEDGQPPFSDCAGGLCVCGTKCRAACPGVLTRYR
jgi:hypothetical protein